MPVKLYNLYDNNKGDMLKRIYIFFLSFFFVIFWQKIIKIVFISTTFSKNNSSFAPINIQKKSVASKIGFPKNDAEISL